MKTFENVCRWAAIAAMLVGACEVVGCAEAPAMIKGILYVMALLAVLQVHAIVRQILWIAIEREEELRLLNEKLDGACKRRGCFDEERDDRHKPSK